ncbi:2'-5' RNA ligase family protein [Sphingomonas mesophila]|uniref:2'-5' RNA ligase family protein n=1 Tax=Sphingomonas mesophila TaxID=2303576 RepID=UPI000E57C7D5|nr:2'-5' RNA ligase family protein [Sphingomonas mesophila]
MAGALIVTAELGPADFAWLDGQRRAYFPPERNQLAAHLTMFHALPPGSLDEVRGRLAELARNPPPRATIAGLLNLGRGVAYRVVAPELEAMRGELAEAFHGLLSAQDAAGWRPHVTIQNKVEPAVARKLLSELERDFTPRGLAIPALQVHEYLGGPWAPLGRWPFRGRR